MEHNYKLSDRVVEALQKQGVVVEEGAAVSAPMTHLEARNSVLDRGCVGTLTVTVGTIIFISNIAEKMESSGDNLILTSDIAVAICLFGIGLHNLLRNAITGDKLRDMEQNGVLDDVCSAKRIVNNHGTMPASFAP